MAFLSFFGTGSRLGSKRASAPFLPLAAGGVLQKDRKALSSHSSAKCNQASSSAFTIVELLIVVVVIAILAAVTIVAYNGITNRAKGSAVASSVTQAGKKLEVFKTTTGAGFYPADITAANTAIGSSLTLTKYLTNTPTNPTNYCATITDTSTSPATSYSVSSTSSTTMAGECVENLVVNPSGEATASGYVSCCSDPGALQPAVVTASDAPIGKSYIRRSFNVGSYNGYFFSPAITTSAGEIFNVSAYLRSNRTFTLGSLAQVSNSVPAYAHYAGQSVSPTWSRHNVSVTIPATMTAISAVFYRFGSFVVDDWLDVDGAMVTRGSVNYSYGDGSSPGWFWKGAPNASTSIGPAIAL